MNQHVLAYYIHRMHRSMRATRKRCEMYLIWSDGKLLTMPENYRNLGHPALNIRKQS